MTYFKVHICSIVEEEFHQRYVLNHDCDMEGRGSINVASVDLGLLIWVIAVLLCRRLAASTAFPLEMAWKRRLLPGNSGRSTLFINITEHQKLHDSLTNALRWQEKESLMSIGLLLGSM